MFAFVLWDVKRRRLLAARDHLGQKPLYYYATTSAASPARPRSRRCSPSIGRRPRMNLAALDQYLALRLIDAPLSMFEGIHKLPPGHSLVLEAGGAPRIERYWQLRAGAEADRHAKSSCATSCEAKLEEALRLHLVSDVPVGAFLSGGMDSSLLVAMLARKLGVRRSCRRSRWGLTISASTKRPPRARSRKLFGTEHHEERVKPEIPALLPDLVAALDEPSDPLSLCTWLLARFTRRHVKVVIGGDGGDELFGGYDRYYGNLYASHYGKVPEACVAECSRRRWRLIPESGWYKSVGHQLRWLHHLSFHSGRRALRREPIVFLFRSRASRRSCSHREVRRSGGKLDAEAAIRAPYEESQRRRRWTACCIADSMVRLPNHPVMITDRICMAHGLEARSPFMDHELASLRRAAARRR